MPKSPITNLTAGRLRELARTGAEVTLKRLRAEIIAIERTFPELASAAGPPCRPHEPSKKRRVALVGCRRRRARPCRLG